MEEQDWQDVVYKVIEADGEVTHQRGETYHCTPAEVKELLVMLNRCKGDSDGEYRMADQW